jgi:hypothetical protein
LKPEWWVSPLVQEEKYQEKEKHVIKEEIIKKQLYGAESVFRSQ